MQVFAGIMDFYAEGEPVLGETEEDEVDSLMIHDDDSARPCLPSIRPGRPAGWSGAGQGGRGLTRRAWCRVRRRWSR